jgi:hypothetical protein
VPWLIALTRGHHNLAAIFLLNLLLGWTFIGWVAALVWAFTNPPPGLQRERPTEPTASERRNAWTRYMETRKREVENARNWRSGN